MQGKNRFDNPLGDIVERIAIQKNMDMTHTLLVLLPNDLNKSKACQIFDTTDPITDENILLALKGFEEVRVDLFRIILHFPDTTDAGMGSNRVNELKANEKDMVAFIKRLKYMSEEASTCKTVEQYWHKPVLKQKKPRP